MEKNMQDFFNTWLEKEGQGFSGVYSVSGHDGVIFRQACGYRNRAEKLPNTVDTAFAIASGTKLFTGLAVCKLVDEKKLSLEDKLCNVLPFDLGQIDKRVTIFHLLTHTSGVGDYIDEEADGDEDQLQGLYNKYPVYLWKRLEYYLQMITPLPPKFEPGKRFGYSNSGFVLLGLVVEAISGISYQQFVQETIIKPCNLARTGYYRMDSLPPNTALGYMQDEESGNWHSNIFSMPILGGSDGGLFTCAEDLDKLWRAIFANKILTEDMTFLFLKSHVNMDGDDEHSSYYGLGVYIEIKSDKPVYYAVGGDYGVDFFTAYFPATGIVASALGNTNINTFPLLDQLLSAIAIHGE